MCAARSPGRLEQAVGTAAELLLAAAAAAAGWLLGPPRGPGIGTWISALIPHLPDLHSSTVLSLPPQLSLCLFVCDVKIAAPAAEAVLEKNVLNAPEDSQ